MTWPTDRIILGAPSYGIRPRTEHVIFHTTEGTDSSLAAGIATAKWQGTSGNTSGGSYNFILTDGGPILSVPYMEIAGSVTSSRDPAIWQPGRYPWMKELLSPAAYSDVNAYCLAISVSGKTARLRNYEHIGRIINDAARLILWAERQPDIKDNLVVTGHFMWQTNRSDPGQWFLDRVMRRYTEIKTGSPPMPEPGDDLVLISSITEVFPSGTRGKFVPQAPGSEYILVRPLVTGTMDNRKWNPSTVRQPRVLAKVSVNGGEPMVMIGSGDMEGWLVAPQGPQPVLESPPPIDCNAVVAAALIPYQQRLEEFKALAGKDL